MGSLRRAAGTALVAAVSIVFFLFVILFVSLTQEKGATDLAAAAESGACAVALALAMTGLILAWRRRRKTGLAIALVAGLLVIGWGGLRDLVPYVQVELRRALEAMEQE